MNYHFNPYKQRQKWRCFLNQLKKFKGNPPPAGFSLQIYAEKICEENGWDQEFWEWFDEEISAVCITSRLMRDFLVYKKGYCLIHDPVGNGYIVTHKKSLTKKQREFLYDYFVAAGDKTRAKEYLEH